MSFYAITALINAITGTILGLFVYFKNEKAKTNRAFALFCLSMAVWSYAYYFWQVTDNANSALFWSRGLMIGAIFGPIFYFYFVLRLINKVKERKKSLIFGYLIFFFFFLTNFTSLFVKGVSPKLGFAFWPEPGIFYHSFLLAWIFYALYAVYLLFKKYFSSSGIIHTQIKYIFIGTIIGYLGVATNYLLWYDIPIPPIGNWTAAFYLAIVAYAILKYRLMDIRVAIKRSTIFSGVIIIITAVYVMAAFLLGSVFFSGVYTFRSQVITGLIVAILVAVGFRPLYEWLKRTTDVFLFKGEYKPEELMADVTDVLSRTLDLDKVINTLEGQITQALRLENMEVVVFGKEDLEFKARKALNKLAGYFKKEREVLVLEELKRKHSEGILSDKNFLYIEEMEKLKSALVIPLVLKERLLGLFLLKAKKSGDMFTNEDINTLETIASQASIAIENARLYEEMKDFSKTLQKEVNFQTKKLRDANIRLQQLDKAKSEFISLASHQLRTPLSIIKGYISMMIEGSWGKVNKEQESQLEKVYLSNERLIRLVDDLLAVSRIESGRLELDFEMVSLEKMVISVIEEFKKVFSDKGLYLKYIKSKNLIPLIKIDSLKIRQVVQNLIDNAFQYTTEGGATIRFKTNKDKIIFSIKDTGIGVSKKEKVNLFEKFSRGHSGTKVHTEGTGLGLYLAAKLVTVHKGRTWVESEGKDKGSTFYFELPIKGKGK
ncbi:GAF domain-containing protein [Patescibacteria group bacterium]|nr:GAF domain-containing protein [Patescibacteria group bacterium]MBU2472782.1 GAF domain-containing protein [Patescibacteria group bacterium]